ncbi:MAG: DUF1554 domain-containing protein [Spirochaetia bacterium]|nr:DUF1554 domain-containing protein [Spirochaetia bacterium]
MLEQPTLWFGIITASALRSLTLSGPTWNALLLAFFSLFVCSCEKPYRENACDPMSKDFQDILITKAILGDSSSNCAAGSSAIIAGTSPKLIFVSNSTSSGNLGGIPGADSICNSDSAKPANTGTYKALIALAAVRVASLTANVGDGQVDWVLRPNQVYTRPDGTQIMTTNAASLYVFGPNLTNAIGTTGSALWTGLNGDWTTAGGCGAAWNDGTSGVFGRYGVANAATQAAINGGNLACNNLGSLFCVQQ